LGLARIRRSAPATPQTDGTSAVSQPAVLSARRKLAGWPYMHWYDMGFL
jgi:hypothetical protein